MGSGRAARHRERNEIAPEEIDAWRPFTVALGPLAVVDLETTGLPSRHDTEIIEIGAVLLEADGHPSGRIEHFVRPKRPPSPFIRRLTGIGAVELEDAAPIGELAPSLARAFAGRTLVAHNAAFERHFLARYVSPALAQARYLDTQDVLGLTYPDAPDLRLETFTRLLLDREEGHRALDDAFDTLHILAELAMRARRGERRYRNADRALARFDPRSAWRPLLAGAAVARPPSAVSGDYVPIEPSSEAPVRFDERAIASALADEARGRRHFERYRVRPEQIELARHFYRTLRDGGVLLLEGGTGVGKSLAYLAAAIPLAMERAEKGERGGVVVSTRTKLLQDQLLQKDIAAAARFLGHAGLRALSIKGRANYVCERLLQRTLAEGRGNDLLAEDRHAHALLLACARTRAGGEVGGLPGALLRRHPLLRDLLRRSVSQRAEQCTREQCAGHPDCPFGHRRRALSAAHLIVANHDLLLRWPPDYPRLTHVIADEGHELAGVSDEVYAASVRPEEILERVDEIFGGEPGSAAGRAEGLLPRAQRTAAASEVAHQRRDLVLDATHLGRLLASAAGQYGELQLPADADRLYPEAAQRAQLLAGRVAALARLAARLERETEDAAANGSEPNEEWRATLVRDIEALHDAAVGLESAFHPVAGPDVVAGFERLSPPYDRWRLALRPVSPASDFHEQFLQGLESFAAVSASLFVRGDAFAALGELEIEERARFGVERVSLPSPFDYRSHMRALALRSLGSADSADLVGQTTAVLARLARLLGGRTLALFTSLRRLGAVADRLASELAGEPIEVLAPRSASDDPAALVRRFRTISGSAVLLGSRTFWQGVDIPGEALQAVVIEKLPFEVPTELRRRREARVAELGMNAFERFRLGKMLLHLKQMSGRLIRSEEDRGVVVIVDARSDRHYFDQLDQAFPEGVTLDLIDAAELPDVLSEIELGPGSPPQMKSESTRR